MNIQENTQALGKVFVTVTGPDGQVKETRDVTNLVVTTGKNYIASRMTGTTTAMSHMALGSSSTAPANGDTTLGSELGRVALSSGTTSGAVTTYAATFPAGTATGAVVEAGIFNAGSAGTMLARVSFSVINKGANDTVTVTWSVTIS